MKFDPGEMAQILEQAKRYTDSQKLAHTEKKVLTYDGNPDNAGSANEYGTRWAIVAEEGIDLTSVSKLMLTDIEGETYTFEVNETNSAIQDFGGGNALCISINGSFGPAVISIEGVTAVAYYTNMGYVSYVEYETIHPIPQEYIPPLDRLILNGADGKQYALTITDGALSVAPVTT